MLALRFKYRILFTWGHTRLYQLLLALGYFLPVSYCILYIENIKEKILRFIIVYESTTSWRACHSALRRKVLSKWFWGKLLKETVMLISKHGSSAVYKYILCRVLIWTFIWTFMHILHWWTASCTVTFMKILLDMRDRQYFLNYSVKTQKTLA